MWCRYAVFTTKFLDIISNSMENDRITQSQMLGYFDIVYRYLPSQVKKGLVIFLCIFERTIVKHKTILIFKNNC